MSRHVHTCAGCHEVLYVCYEPIRRDDCGASCANAHESEREYCADCCVQLREDAAEIDEPTDADAGGAL